MPRYRPAHAAPRRAQRSVPADPDAGLDNGWPDHGERDNGRRPRQARSGAAAAPGRGLDRLEGGAGRRRRVRRRGCDRFDDGGFDDGGFDDGSPADACPVKARAGPARAPGCASRGQRGAAGTSPPPVDRAGPGPRGVGRAGRQCRGRHPGPPARGRQWRGTGTESDPAVTTPATVVSGGPPGAVSEISAASKPRTPPGSAGWKLTNVAANHEIEGYADHTSITAGQPVTLFVSTTAHVSMWRCIAWATTRASGPPGQ